MTGGDARARRWRAWAWAGVAFAVLAVILWTVVAFVALDADDEGRAAPDGVVRLGTARAATDGFPGMTEVQLGVDGECKRIVVADESTERVQGLRGRRDVGPYDGMLFVYDAPTAAPFTMSGVPVPLDIGFYAADGSPVSRLRMEPCPKAEAGCPVYRSEAEFLYALETTAGGLADGPLTTCPS